MSVRDETVSDLYLLDQTSEGNPAEEGLVRYVAGDIVARVSGVVKSLTASGGTDALCYLVLTSEGGIVYNLSGEPSLKQVP